MPPRCGRPRPPRARTCAARTPRGRRRSRAPWRTRARPRWRTSAAPSRNPPGNRPFLPPDMQGSSGCGRGLRPDVIQGAPGMARLRLTPQKAEFFDLYAQASSNAVEIARLLVDLLDRFPDDGAGLIAQIKEREHEGDRLTHEVVNLLNRTFVTPFDRDDMYRLASALDDICDHIDEATGNILGYGVTAIRENAHQQAAVIERAATKLRDAVLKLEGFKDSKRELIELRELEDEGDRLNREGIAELFASSDDAISIIRWKDIHEQLEEAVDACENAADVLEAILVKNR